jgi:hypothetical protein
LSTLRDLDCHQMHSWQTEGAVSSVAPVSPLTRGGIQPISSTSTSTRPGWRSAIRAR